MNIKNIEQAAEFMHRLRVAQIAKLLEHFKPEAQKYYRAYVNTPYANLTEAQKEINRRLARQYAEKFILPPLDLVEERNRQIDELSKAIFG